MFRLKNQRAWLRLYMRKRLVQQYCCMHAYGQPAGSLLQQTVAQSATAQVAPVFVFSESLNNDTKSIWEAVSHEVGHSLGLS